MRDTNRILPLALLAASLPALGATKGTNVGTFSAGERVSPPGFHAPEHVSRMYVKTVLPDANGRVSLPAVGDSSLIVWTMPLAPSRSGEAARVSGSLRTPAGRRFAAGDEGSTALGLRRFAFDEADLGIDLPKGTHEVIHVEKAEPGLHTLDLSSTSSGALVVVAEPDSRIVLSTWAGPLSHVPGEPATLHADLTNGGAPLAGARVTIGESGRLERVLVRVAAGDPLDEVVLRSYAIGATHMALGWVLSESLTIDPDTGEVHDLTIRSFGILRAKDTPPIDGGFPTMEGHLTYRLSNRAASVREWTQRPGRFTEGGAENNQRWAARNWADAA